MADAELQLITGHARRETLAIYQHIALDGQLEGKYQRGDEQGGIVNEDGRGEDQEFLPPKLPCCKTKNKTI